MNIGEKIVALRKNRKMTQAELGRELHVTYQAVSKWERGDSSPDFSTLSQIAKLFGVPISYFEDGEAGEEAVSEVVAEAEVEPDVPEENAVESVLLGTCKSCGKLIHEDEAFQKTPYILCQDCYDREQREKVEAKKREAERQERMKEIERRRIIHKRNIGLIVAAVVFAVLALVGGILFGIGIFTPVVPAIVAWVVFAVFMFTFLSQMIWGGTVQDLSTFGFIKVNLPGIIFTLDIDGIIFLIVVKVLFGFISIFIGLAFGIIMFLGSILISPITFIPKVIWMSCGKD